MPLVTERLARYASELVFDDLPLEVVERSKLLLLDFLAVTIGGRYKADTTGQLIDAAETLGWRAGTATALGLSADFVPSAAALINGTLAHSLEFDDTHSAASLHPSATVIPAVLAAAEMRAASGRDLITAIVAGYELCCRISKAMVPSEHYARGFHPTATVGVFAAAAAAARVFGLTPDGVANALGLAGSQAAGSMQFMDNAAWNKRFHVGAAAQNGLIAAVLACQGYLGAGAAIEGEKGFLNAYAPNPVPERAVAGLGEHYETMAIALKPYSGCRMVHAAIDATLQLREAHRLAPESVESVSIGLSQLALDITGFPQAQKRRPRSIVESQFSMHMCAAIALSQGSLTWANYETLWQDADILSLCDRVSVYHDAEVQEDYPERLSGRVRIRAAGATHELKIDVPSGEPEQFLSAAEIQNKFAGLVAGHVPDNQIASIAELALRTETLADVRELTTSTLPVLADTRSATAAE